MTHRAVALSVLVAAGLAGGAPCAWTSQTMQSNSAEAHARGLFLEGLQRQQEKRFPEAIQAYERSLRIDSDQPETLSNLGFCYKSMRKFEQAVASYHRALALKPDLAEAREYLGEAYLAMGKTAWAEREYRKLLRLNAKEAQALKEKIDAGASPKTGAPKDSSPLRSRS